LKIVAHTTDTLLIPSYLAAFLFLQGIPSGNKQPAKFMDLRIQRVVALIEEKPGHDLSLADMAQVAGLSPSRLRHKFKSEMGVTPTVYLQKFRLERARQLLVRHELTVKEVKAAVGISSDSYFTHQFKREFGIPPSRSRAY
jgi:AraC-like DNA-binding protein